jgi:6-methylsalicylate decarboxylase
MPFEERIDMHGHFLPPFYRETCKRTDHGKPDDMRRIATGPNERAKY